MFHKLAQAQALLRTLHEKSAGAKVPLLAGAGIAAGVHGIHKTLEKSKEYKAGFYPGVNPYGVSQ